MHFSLSRFFMRAHDIHLWTIDLADADWDRASFVLNVEERARFARLHSASLQSTQARCRIALRLLLAAYTGRPAAALAFQYGPFGKPLLTDGKWHFNVAHSEDKALIGVSAQPLGVDLEWTQKPAVDVDELSSAIFHLHDKQALQARPNEERQDLFYRLWVQKESYLKALGVGLQRDLSAVYFSSMEPATAQVHDEQAEDDSRYFVHFLQLFDGFAASVCVAHASAQIEVREAAASMWIDEMKRPGSFLPGIEDHG